MRVSSHLLDASRITRTITAMRLKIYEKDDYTELDTNQVIDGVYNRALNPDQYLVLLHESKQLSNDDDAIKRCGPTTQEGVVSNGQHNEGPLEEGCDA